MTAAQGENHDKSSSPAHCRGGLVVAASLKQKNVVRLIAVCGFNLAFYAFVLKGGALADGDWYRALIGAIDLLPAGFGLVVISVLNGLISPQAKARLVFWRWRHPLPGCRAFSEYAKADPRVNLPALRSKFGALPKAEGEQNSAWYRMYRSIETEAAVTHAHKEYLFTRDYAALAALMVPTMGGLAFWQASSVWYASSYVACLVTQYVIVRIAATNYGQRFVCTVLAIKSAEA
jgi:hypothetical protein